MTDVLVIGGGMAGVVAAVRARRAGATVVLAREAFGATALSSGAVDLAPPRLSDDGTLDLNLARCAAAVSRGNPDHPFHVLGAELPRIGEALSFAAEISNGLLSAPSDASIFLPTALGTFKATATAQRSQTGASLSKLPAVVAVVGFAGVPLFDAAFIARGLEADARTLGFSTRFVPVQCRFFNQLEDSMRLPVELARRLDAEDAAAAIARELSRVDAAAFLFPPVMGLRTPGVTVAIGAALNRPCAELLADAQGSVPGLRLQLSLDEAVRSSGVQLEEYSIFNEEGDLFLRGLSRRDLPVEARATVLATGKFIGGGIRRAGGKTRETIFSSPVYVSDRRGPDAVISELLGERYSDDQPMFRAGVRINSECRVVGAPRKNVFAAGSVISGFDPATDGGGLGVTIFTAFLAGERAAAAR